MGGINFILDKNSFEDPEERELGTEQKRQLS
jgi:hypothetical protein